MKKITGIGLIVGLILGAILIGIILTVLFPFSSRPFGTPPEGDQPPPPIEPLPGDIAAFYAAKMIISVINITLLIALLIIYVGTYRKVRSKFTLGLIIIMVVLFLYALTSNPLLHNLFGFRAGGLGPFAMIPDLFATVALIVLLYLSLE